MGVTVEHDVVTADWQPAFAVDMSVGEEEPFAAIDKYGIIDHHGKVEQHLVHFGVAVAAHCHDVFGHGVQTVGNALRIDALWYAVARTVVEYVTKYA